MFLKEVVKLTKLVNFMRELDYSEEFIDTLVFMGYEMVKELEEYIN